MENKKKTKNRKLKHTRIQNSSAFFKRLKKYQKGGASYLKKFTKSFIFKIGDVLTKTTIFSIIIRKKEPNNLAKEHDVFLRTVNKFKTWFKKFAVRPSFLKPLEKRIENQKINWSMQLRKVFRQQTSPKVIILLS